MKRIKTLAELRAETVERQLQWEKEALLQDNGATCEKSGDIDNAIYFYNELIKMKFAGSNPYKRLCMIYHKQKAYKKELEVIEKYRKVVGANYFDACQEGKYKWFRERKAKLTELLQR